MKVGFLRTCGKYLHYRIILLREGVWTDRTRLPLSNFIIIAVPLPSQESERSRVYVLVVSILPLATIFYTPAPP